jgi:ribosomal protein S18 acetylase RimI-like enzyme
MKTIEIKRISLNEADRLQSIGKRTFAETFSSVNSEENMKEYLDKRFSIKKLIEELSDQHSEFYFALIDNKVAGYLKINFGPAQTEIKDDNAVEIERIYVLKDFHGQQVGQKLFEKALDISRQKNADHVWLGVWEKNYRALRFYQKNGFVVFDTHIFKLGNAEQTDLLMKIQIVSTPSTSSGAGKEGG